MGLFKHIKTLIDEKNTRHPDVLLYNKWIKRNTKQISDRKGFTLNSLLLSQKAKEKFTIQATSAADDLAG